MGLRTRRGLRDPRRPLTLTTVAGPGLVAAATALAVVTWLVDPSTMVPSDYRAPVGLAGVVIAVTLFAARARTGQAGDAVASVAASALTTLAIAASSGAGDFAAVFFVPIGVYSAYVLSRPLATASVVGIALGLAAALWLRGTDAPALAWSLTMSTVAASSYVVRVLRRRLRAVIADLDALASHDHLTGILNRRGIEERLETELARAARSGLPLTVLVGDLDEFKALNDAHGHAVGDHALRCVAATIRDAIRASDAVGRIGGDEFLVVLPDTAPPGGRAQARRLRARLDRALAALPGDLALTVGAATYPTDAETAEALVRAADAALYERKRLRPTEVTAR